MNIRTCAAALLLAAGLPTAVLAVDYPEIEPNETKAQALTNGVFTLSAGDAVTGTSTGASTTTAGAASADTFLIKTTPAALGIYRHRLTITTSGTAGHTGSIRGLSATSSGVGTTDNAMVTSSSTTTPARYVQWYGFGKQEQLYYRVAGGTTTTAAYRAELSSDVVTPAAASTNAESGTITISDATSATTTPYDNDMFLFDSSFNPIVGIDDPDSSGMVANLAPGTYYVGFSSYNMAAGRMAGAVTAPAVGGIQGTWQTGPVLDFNDLVTSSRTTTTTTVPTSISIAAPNGTQTVPGSIIGFADVQWFTFNVVPAVSPTPPSGTGTATPSIVVNDGTGVTTLRVTVTPGANPTSTFLTTGTVTVNGASIGAGTVTLLDNGVAPDLVAGDNIFSANATVANGTAAGAATLPFTITDDQGRSGTGNIALTVSTPAPGCSSGLATLSFVGPSSNNAIGGAGNTIVTGDFGYAGNFNQLAVSGRVTAFGASWRSEARVRATAPDGSTYDIAFGLPASAGTSDVVDFIVPLTGFEAGTGTWTFEFFESTADADTPDATWQQICFAGRLTATNPTATGVATPNNAVNDGSGTTVLAVTVNPGASPTSTFATTGSVTVTSAVLTGGSVTLLDNGVAPDAVAGDLIFTANAGIASGAPAGAATLPFNVTDDQGRSATGNIAFTVTTPPPSCPAGLATLSFTNASSDGAVGDPDNTIVTGDFGLGDYVNVIRMSGRLVSNAIYNLEARVQATSPDGRVYLFQPFTTTPSTSPRDLASATFNLANLEAGVGTWTFEFYESFNDGATPDATWTSVCFSVDQVSTPLSATGAAAPTSVVRDGVATTTLRVSVAPAHFPESTGVAVVVDDSSVGGSGSLTLLDDGNAPDLVAGDNIFSANTTVAYTTALGAATLPFTVTDDQGANVSGNINFTVAEASGACCTGSGCIVTTIGDCLDVQFGTYAGTGTACTAPTALTTEGAGAFEDISTTGTLAATLVDADDAYETIALPFTFNFFGNDYTSINVVTNGFAQFTGTSTAYLNGPIPSAAVPNDSLYPLWDDFDFFTTGAVYTQLLGTIGTDARFIIQWNNVGQYNLGNATTDVSTFQIALFEDGSFEYRYQTVSTEFVSGDTSTIGFENGTGTIAYQSAETRASLNASAPISFRANSTLNDTGVCGNGCPACAADYDNNGGVDGADLAAFFADYEAGETCSDVDANGGTDGADLAFFFAVYEQGGC